MRNLKSIIIPRQSRGFFLCGQSPRLLATPSQAFIRSATCVSSVTSHPLTGSSSLLLFLATRKRVVIFSQHRHLLSQSVFVQLMLDILCYLLFVFPYRVYIIPSTPKLSIPILVFHISELLVDHQAALPFQISHKARHCYLRRYTYQHMYMISTYLCLMDFYLLPFTQLPQYLSYRLSFLSKEYLPPILRCKHYMIFAIPFRSVYKELHADRETGC